MHKDPAENFREPENRNFYFEGTKFERAYQLARFLIAFAMMRAEKFFQRLKNRLWVV